MIFGHRNANDGVKNAVLEDSSSISNNNNVENNINNINLVDNMVLSNSNNANQLTISILPVPG